MTPLLDGVLVVLAVATGLRAVAAREAVACVVAFLAFGVVLTLAWVRLAAVDVALTEAAVGTGITGLVLLRAAGRGAEEPDAPLPAPARTLAALLAAGVAAGLAAVVLQLPDPAPSLASEAARHLAATEMGNPVTSVLLVYRAIDTLLEKVVLLLALVGVWSLSRDPAWNGPPAPLAEAAPLPALAFLARILPAVGIVVGLHLFWTGADAPGGAFQGGAVLAAMALLVLLAGLKPVPALGGRLVRVLILVGPVAFLATGMAGWLVAGTFLAYPEGFVKPVIIAVEVAIVASVAVTLAALVLGPAEEDATS